MATNGASDSDEETRAFLQRRLSLVCAVMTLILAFISLTNWTLWGAGLLPAQIQNDFPRVGFATVALAICAHHLHSTPQAPSVRRPGVSPALDAVVLRCLAKKPDDRYRSVGELRAALLEVAAGAGSPWTAADAVDWWRVHGEPFKAHTARRRADRLTATDQEVAQVDRQRRIGAAPGA